jgi:hypothetical protein
MDSSRREFLERAASSAAMFGAFPFAMESTLRAFDSVPTVTADEWDLNWVKRITGKHKAVFDVPGIESGFGVWRASIWGKQYMDVLAAKPADISTVVVLRHDAIILAMQQSFWDKYGVGKAKEVKHPITQEITDKNPVLLSSTRNEVPAQFDAVALDKFLARGGIVLACNLAFADCVELVKSKENLSAEEARKQAIAGIIPGVVLQPSGVFGVIRAQEAGATYIRAS